MRPDFRVNIKRVLRFRHARVRVCFLRVRVMGASGFDAAFRRTERTQTERLDIAIRQATRIRRGGIGGGVSARIGAAIGGTAIRRASVRVAVVAGGVVARRAVSAVAHVDGNQINRYEHRGGRGRHAEKPPAFEAFHPDRFHMISSFAFQPTSTN